MVLILIMLLPWLFPYIKEISFPGWTITFRDIVNQLQKTADDENVLEYPSEVSIPERKEKVITGVASEDPLVFTAEDPNLVLAALRIELEKKIRELAIVSKISESGRTVYSILNSLVNQRRLPHSTSRYIGDILNICNLAVHGKAVDAYSAARVLKIGKEIIRWLDSRIYLIETIDYTVEDN